MAAPVISAPTRCGFEVPFWVLLKNNGCVPAPAFCALHSNGLAEYVSADPAPVLVQGDSIIWRTTDSLQPGETRAIFILLKIAGVDHLGDTLKMVSFASALDSTASPVGQPATSVFASQINCSYDPNDKLVNRIAVPDTYDPVQQTLEYTIRFQNTGTDTAFNIRVLDTLATELDWATFRPLGSSHRYFPFLDPKNGQIEFRFDNIYLPDSSANEPGSHGMVSFSIQMKPGLPPGTTLPNRAAIYFDFNPPVMTNSVETKILLLLDLLPEQNKIKRISILPNPNHGLFAIELSETAEPGMVLKISDLAGRAVFEKQAEGGSQRQMLRAESLPPGLYFLQVVSEGKLLSVEKFVKE